MIKLLVIIMILSLFIFTACEGTNLFILEKDQPTNNTQSWESECQDATCGTYIETLSSSS